VLVAALVFNLPGLILKLASFATKTTIHTHTTLRYLMQLAHSTYG
jgi:hypothetical protein